MRKDFGPFAGILVGWSCKRSGRCHDVAIDVTTGTDCTGSNVHNAGNDSLEISFENAVKLKALSCCGTEITLAVFVGQVIQEAVELRWKFSRRLLESEHKLEVFYFALDFAIGLLV